MEKNQLNKLFSQKFIRPIFYDQYFKSVYGDDWANLEPETIWLDIKDATGISDVLVTIRDKVNAIKVLKTTNRYFDDIVGFEKITIAFNDSYVDTTTFQICSPADISLGVLYVSELFDKTEILSKFTNDVKMYIKGACDSWGLIYYPKFLRDIQEEYKEGTLAYKVIQDMKKNQFNEEQYKEKASVWQKSLLRGINEYVESMVKKGELNV